MNSFNSLERDGVRCRATRITARNKNNGIHYEDVTRCKWRDLWEHMLHYKLARPCRIDYHSLPRTSKGYKCAASLKILCVCWWEKDLCAHHVECLHSCDVVRSFYACCSKLKARTITFLLRRLAIKKWDVRWWNKNNGHGKPRNLNENVPTNEESHQKNVQFNFGPPCVPHQVAYGTL